MPSSFSSSSEQLEGIARLAVHLVDKRKNQDMAHGATLKSPGLRLDALGPSMTMTAESAAMSVR